MDYYIGIPSYKRPKLQGTLDYLEKLGVSKEKIIMSVQTEEDYAEYKKSGYEERVGTLLKREANNVAGNRNTILDYLGTGKRVVMLDDDISSIAKLESGKLIPISTLYDFEKFINKGFSEAFRHHSPMWGIYPVYNAFFMGNRVRERYIVIGTLMGITVTSLRFNEKMNTKEDYEFACHTIRRFGASIRLDNFACKAQHRTAGGCSEFWKERENVSKTAALLVSIYPDILQMNPKRPGEVLMRREKK